MDANEDPAKSYEVAIQALHAIQNLPDSNFAATFTYKYRAQPPPPHW